MTRIGVVCEQAGETRVAATPDTLAKIIALGYEVLVEKGAGAKSASPDAQYEKAGASIVTTAQAWSADIVMKVNAPTDKEIEKLSAGTTLISLLSPALRP